MNHRQPLLIAIAAVSFACTGSPALGADAALTVADYKSILDSPSRSAEDKADDGPRKPAEILAFSQVKRGETILELQAGRGWFSEIISAALGPNGELIIQRPPQMATSAPVLQARIDAGKLKNATVMVTEFDKLDIPDASVDRVLWYLGPHELYFTPRNSQPGALGDVKKTYAGIARVLKPGGTFVVLDHAAAAGAPTSLTQTIHRVDPAIVLAAAKEAGFELAERSTLLANPSDDHTKPAFDSTVKRRTDQFLLRFRKPS
jgi:predicted methyltransferase